jgi:hypothetical protein
VRAGSADSEGSAQAATGGWNVNGNAGLTSSNFLGSTDSKTVVFKSNNAERMRITNSGLVGINNASPVAQLHVKRSGGDTLKADYTGTAAAAAVHAVATQTAGVPVLAVNNRTPVLMSGVAVQGYSAGGADARVHPSGGFYDAAGEFSGANGVIGAASSNPNSDGYGVIGIADNTYGTGMYAQGINGARALIAQGDVDVRGTLTKSGGSFLIDHPLTPATKYLSHSFVESPDMKSVYDGVVVADKDGQTVVTMPDWFEALNQDLRYQLTPMGGPAPQLHVSRELSGGTFAIAGATPGQKISWQLTGIRHDAWAQANRIPLEQDKPVKDKGTFLHPELFGAPTAKRAGRQL